jgi:hypothetical protein
MVYDLRQGVDCPNEELWTIAAQWCGRLGVLMDWWRARITAVCVWQVANPVDGLPMSCHGELQWVHLGCFGFGTNKMASCVYQVDEIESSLGQRVAHCRSTTVYEAFDPRG